MMPLTSSPRAAAGLGLAAGLGVAVGLPGVIRSVPGTGATPAPAVPPAVVSRALASEPPDRPTMSDDIAHFRARLADRGDEEFSRRRLVASHLLRFRAYASPEDLDAAAAHLEALEAAGVRHPGVLAARASLHLTRHEFRAAREAAAEAVRAAGTYDATLQLRLFDALWASGAYDRAAALLELPHDTASVDYRARKARVLDRLGHVERARDHMRQVLRKVRSYAEPAPVVAWALVELGLLEHHSGDPVRAVQLFLDALDVLPGSPAALEGLAAVAYGVDRDVAAARALYARALENGGHLDLLPVLARLHEEAGAPERARTLREELVRRATTDGRSQRWALRPLALTLAEDPGTVCRALTWARRDLSDRRDAGAWDALAWTLFRKGDVGAAWEASREATSWGVPEPGTAYRAGLIAAAHGDGTRARSMLRVAVDGATELTTAQVREAARLLEGGAPGPLPGAVDCR